MKEQLGQSLFQFQPGERFAWYQVNALLQEIGQESARIKLSPQDVIHIGGTAHFHRCLQMFGPSFTFFFRGTHDIDVLSFTNGTMQRLFSNLSAKSDPLIADYEVKRSSNLNDKKTVTLSLNRFHDPALPTRLEVDVFEPGFYDVIRYNDRILQSNRLVFDLPEKLCLPAHRGLVAVPSLIDGFILKMDVVNFSRSGLRPKDIFDVLVSLRIMGELDIKASDVLEAFMEDTRIRQMKVPLVYSHLCDAGQKKEKMKLRDGLVDKLTGLEEILRACQNGNLGLPERYPFLPCPSLVNDSLFEVKQAKKFSAKLMA